MKILLILLQLVYVSSSGSDEDENKMAIVNGAPYDPDKYPCVVLIQSTEFEAAFYTTTTCTGTLITPMYVLTAGHCIPNSTEIITIYKGHKSDNITRKVQKLFLHPEYDINKKSVKDVGLMKLQKPFDNVLVYAVLYKGDGSEFENNQEITCQMIGFGKLPNDDNTEAIGYLANIKSRHSPTACGDKGVEKYAFWEEVICSRDQAEKTCPGDSGGPLFCNGYLYGISSATIFYPPSTGIKCGDPNHIVKHMYVRYYLKYITDVINTGNPIAPYSELYMILFMIRWLVRII